MNRKTNITNLIDNMKEIKIYGAGLAGCEAAWQAQKLGVHVKLYEMKPGKFSPAHHSPDFAELVCSNSLRSNQLSNAVGLLKEELRRLDSLIMEAAYANILPAGSALAVDREGFSKYITDKIRECENIEVIEEECTSVGDGITVIATGPLSSDGISDCISELIGGKSLHFFDAAAPIVDFSSIDMTRAFFASRYDKGDADYVNCPFTEQEYRAFYDALVTAEEAPLKEFDREQQNQLKVFEGCMPVEVMAKRGYDTLRYGPMKPVGITLPGGGEAYAIVQLRRDNNEGTMYNIVGFQTHLTFEAQRRVFRMIPGLENAEFLRYGVMHRNTYINSPGLLGCDYSMCERPNVFFAGQMTGVEGYVESASSGFVAGVCAAMRALGLTAPEFPRTTVIGALAHYVSHGGVSSDFQPMNANFGIVEPLDKKVKGGKKFRNEALAERSLEVIEALKASLSIENKD
jgi:methylenetetrahydrofolate--tRNA-(uracil-5-)-methyltransferase